MDGATGEYTEVHVSTDPTSGDQTSTVECVDCAITDNPELNGSQVVDPVTETGDTNALKAQAHDPQAREGEGNSPEQITDPKTPSPAEPQAHEPPSSNLHAQEAGTSDPELLAASNGESLQSVPPSPGDLQDAGQTPQTGGRGGQKLPRFGIPSSYTTSANGHIWVYDEQGRLSWDLSAERAKPYVWNTNPNTGEAFMRDSGLHLPVPDEWLALLP